MIIELAKRLTRSSVPLPTATPWYQRWNLPNERDYRRDVGDGSGSNLVGPGIDYIADAFVEAPLRLRRYEGEKLSSPILDHSMIKLINNPNPYYSGALLWMPTISNWISDGNAYWLPLHWTAAGEPLDLYFVPSMFIEPKAPRDGSAFLSHYEYKPGYGNKIDLSPEEVIHFRWGLDPKNPLKGYSRLKRVLREIFSDEEAARFTAALLRNMGAPGLMIFPKGDGVTDEEAKDAKAEIIQNTTGDRRGEPLVMRSESGLETYGFSPAEMDLSNLRAIPESRVAAALQIPAAVLGFLAGMAQTKVGATMLELREQAYESGVAPKQRLFCQELATQLLSFYTDDVTKYKLDHDLSEVRVLQEDRGKLVERIDRQVRSGWMTVERAKLSIGEVPLPGDKVYLRPLNVEAVAEVTRFPSLCQFLLLLIYQLRLPGRMGR